MDELRRSSEEQTLGSSCLLCVVCAGTGRYFCSDVKTVWPETRPPAELVMILASSCLTQASLQQCVAVPAGLRCWRGSGTVFKQQPWQFNSAYIRAECLGCRLGVPCSEVLSYMTFYSLHVFFKDKPCKCALADFTSSC